MEKNLKNGFKKIQIRLSTANINCHAKVVLHFKKNINVGPNARFYFVGQLEGCHAYNSGLLAYPSPETIIKHNLSRRAKPAGENVSCHASRMEELMLKMGPFLNWARFFF